MTELTSGITLHRLALRVTPVPTGELFLVSKFTHDAYVWGDGLFTAVFARDEVPSKEKIQHLLRTGQREVFVAYADREEIRSRLEQAMIQVTRSLSIGDPKLNGGRALKLMGLNLTGLYQNPHDDVLLMKQFQSTQNMGKFLLENKKLQGSLYQELARENMHFTILQPMLSSILLLSFLQSNRLFHDKEIETLFQTSCMKDVGIGLIPEEKYDIKGLTHDEQLLFSQHAEFSHDILEGRLPLSKNQLSIIKHHHFLNDRLKRILTKDTSARHEPQMAFGFETTAVAIADVIVAMTSVRPYRPELTLFQALEFIRIMIADEYPQEFKALVIHLRQFFR